MCRGSTKVETLSSCACKEFRGISNGLAPSLVRAFSEASTAPFDLRLGSHTTFALRRRRWKKFAIFFVRSWTRNVESPHKRMEPFGRYEQAA